MRGLSIMTYGALLMCVCLWATRAEAVGPTRRLAQAKASPPASPSSPGVPAPAPGVAKAPAPAPGVVKAPATAPVPGPASAPTPAPTKVRMLST
eukprot:jgi/Botrbrau1/1291/Bobra.0063s0008.1